MAMSEVSRSLSTIQIRLKRTFDFWLALLSLILIGWLIILAWVLASIDTRSNGFFLQKRVGRGGQIFTVVKIKTMNPKLRTKNTVTQSGDPRITKLGYIFRKAKIDELPQLFNVLLGQMSFVGPRPDVPGYADQLQGADRRILELQPGITGPATLAYRNEEELLAQVADPIRYNDKVIYPHKVRLNLEYLDNYSLGLDIQYIVQTIFH
jgi:lipopolysaccharide/colanic/teichoic acid biosynthesis glycosyltransferase